MRKVLFYALLVLIANVQSFAQDFSYLYIQGDKKTPIYVKVEGAMAPRYGKNYAIIPQLAPGPTHVSVLFQQNAFPQQDFIIMVPEKSSRSFLLTQSEGKFSLYDIDQRFFLRAGNTIEEDNPSGAPAALAQREQIEKMPQHVRPETAKTTGGPPQAQDSLSLKVTRNTDPQFIDGITLNRAEPLTPQNGGKVAATPAPTAQDETIMLRNSDCPEAMGSEDFQKLYRQMLAQGEDENRASFLLKQTNRCFATWQVRALASTLHMEAARFSVVRKLYSRVSDQQNFPLLDDLFREPSWQEAFQKLINP